MSADIRTHHLGLQVDSEAGLRQTSGIVTVMQATRLQCALLKSPWR
jgi:hypothetical protein